MATWPTALPKPTIDGYGVQPFDQTLRQQFESGPGRARRRFFTPYEKVTASWSFSADEFASFRTWYLSTTGANGGAAWFTIDLAYGDASGFLASVEARFGGPYQATLQSALRWKVSATLELRDA